MCKVTTSDVQADLKAVAEAVTSIADASQATDPTLSADLTKAASSLTAAGAAWQTGSPVTDINTAATEIEIVLNDIPETAPYATYVAIAVAALDILIGNLATQPAATPAAASPANTPTATATAAS